MIPIDYTTAITNGESIESKLAEATKYTRAANRLRSIRTQLIKEKNLASQNKEPDKSYSVVIKRVTACLEQVVGEEDEAWKKVYASAEPHGENIEALARGVVLQAVSDYEQALSAGDRMGQSTLHEIERFADNGSNYFTNVDMTAVLERIRNTYPKYKAYAQANAKDIVEDTKSIRRKKGIFPQAKHRCPLCGGGLYMSGNVQHGKAKICCSNCYLYTWVVI